MKKVLPIITGVIVGFLIVFIGDSVTHRLYPPPAGINFMDKAALDTFVASIPTYVLVVMLLFWLLSSFLGGLVAARLHRADWKKKSIITGSILMAAALLNMIMIPHPLWMLIASIALYIPVAFLGGWMVRPKNSLPG